MIKYIMNEKEVTKGYTLSELIKDDASIDYFSTNKNKYEYLGTLKFADSRQVEYYHNHEDDLILGFLEDLDEVKVLVVAMFENLKEVGVATYEN